MAEKHVPISDDQAQKMMAQQEQQAQQMEANNEQRETVLRAVLSPEARDRLKRIVQVKPERAMQVENHIIMGVRSGKMQPPINDEVVRELLSQMAGGGSGGGSNIKVLRKKSAFDDSDSD